MLAAEIARDAPALTVHDVTHADALWELGSLKPLPVSEDIWMPSRQGVAALYRHKTTMV